MIALMFWLAVVGAVFDWRYMKAGGVRPSKSDYQSLIVAALLCVAAVIGMGVRAGAGAAGDLIALLTALVLGLFEFRRWRIRRAFPGPYRSKRT